LKTSNQWAWQPFLRWQYDHLTPSVGPKNTARFSDDAACVDWLAERRWSDGFSRPTCNHDKDEQAIAAKTALRLGAYFGVSVEMWLNLQSSYDLRQDRRPMWPKIKERVQPCRAG
jgi:hypothetical protein